MQFIELVAGNLANSSAKNNKALISYSFYQQKHHNSPKNRTYSSIFTERLIFNGTFLSSYIIFFV